MALKPQTNALQSEFDWVAFAVLLVGINVSIWMLTGLGFLIPVCLLGIVYFIRRYNWKNVSAAVLLTFTLFHPIRFLFNWQLNPIVYGVASAICLILLIRMVRSGQWKNYVFTLLAVCVFLSAEETFASTTEIERCHVEDVRWTYYFYCDSTGRGYQQIESLPIGMQGYCYYCSWY